MEPLQAPANVLLQAVSPQVRARFSSRFQLVQLNKGDVLQEAGEMVEWVYFPERGLISVQSETVAGEAVESGMIGSEGALGVFEACGSRLSFCRGIVQVPGAALRTKVTHYRELFGACSSLRTAVHKYVELLLAESRQFVLCNAIHPVERRLSRFILDALDRSGSETVLALTQESLAQNLGVQRTTVAACASALQRDGLIRSGRGTLEVLDRPGLERAACSCRPTLEFMRLELNRSTLTACDA
jgi:CRP-like cAMP-binding protein